MRKGNEVPLHKRIHYRRVREAITELAEYEGFNPSDYDLENMKVYETIGENLKGKNVKYNIGKERSCWVYDNWYDFVEVPSIKNKPGSPYGDFLFFAYNSSFHYHLFGSMRVELNRSRSVQSEMLEEEVHFRNYGKYEIVFGAGTSDNRINKVEYGSLFDPGAPSDEHNFSFDSYNVRKLAYGKDRYDILSSLGVNGKNPNKISGSEPVKIYSKKKRSSQKTKPKKSSPKNKGYDKRYH